MARWAATETELNRALRTEIFKEREAVPWAKARKSWCTECGHEIREVDPHCPSRKYWFCLECGWWECNFKESHTPLDPLGQLILDNEL